MSSTPGQTQTTGGEQLPADPQFSPREHVTGSLPAYPDEAPFFRPAYSPYPQQGYQAQGQSATQETFPWGGQHALYPAPLPPLLPYPQSFPDYPITPAQYNGYPPLDRSRPYYYPPYAPYAWQPPHPKRDGYLLTMAILSTIGSSLVLLGGVAVLLITLLVAALSTRGALSASQQFSALVEAIVFIGVGVLGGAFGLYHSVRSLMRKPSADVALPHFWIFLILYVAVVGIAFWLRSRGEEVAFPALTIVLIALAGAFPALTIAALGVRRVRTRVAKPLKSRWPTSWRRFVLALLSGSTLGIGLATILELALLIVLAALLHLQTQALQGFSLCIDTPDAQSCQNPGIYSFILLIVAVIAPLVEETVKPLGVVLLIGRVRSAAEAFVLGMACGIGFDLVETSLYISSGYHDWLSVALLRTGAGLLHGFGAAMVALGWYYLTHAKKRRGRPQGSSPRPTLPAPLLAFGCWFYAVLQHAVWNGSWGLTLLPAPVGPFVANWTLNLGFVQMPLVTLINIIEALLMLAFFIYVAGKLRVKIIVPPSQGEIHSLQPADSPVPDARGAAEALQAG